MIRITDVSKQYGKKRALADISLRLDNKTYGLLGANGAGKTTLIRILAGVLKKSGGEIDFQNKKPQIGYLPQIFGCFPELTVWEQMEYFAALKGLPGSSTDQAIKAALKMTDMEEHSGTKCRKLSGGMTRRVGIAQALLGKPEILLLDEPTVGLDPEEQVRFHNIIKRLEGSAAILISSHIVDDIQSLCDNVIILNQGKMTASGSIAQISQKAKGHVAQLPEDKLRELKGPFFVEKYFSMDRISYARVLFPHSVPFPETACDPDLEDGYLYLIKYAEEKSIPDDPISEN